MISNPFKLFFLLSLILSACSVEQENKVKNDVVETKIIKQAAIAIPDKYAAKVAEDILKLGGNAVDAAVATGFALAVTYIDAGNIGGGGFMMIYIDGKPYFLDYRETAPLAAHRDMYLDDDKNVIENASLIGAKAAGVPGTVAGFWKAHKRFGKLTWQQVIAPAIILAEQGFIPHKNLTEAIQSNFDWFGTSTNFQQYFGNVVAGQNFKQPELAETLRRISKDGAKDFYHGKTAELIVAQMKSAGGIISFEDLNQYKAVWREPLQAKWRDYQILSTPPPSSGGFGVIQLLKMKDYLAKEFESVEHNSPQYIHLVAEMEKRVFADRAEYLGDPAFVDIDMSELISDEYIKRRAAEVDPINISKLESVSQDWSRPIPLIIRL